MCVRLCVYVRVCVRVRVCEANMLYVCVCLSTYKTTMWATYIYVRIRLYMYMYGLQHILCMHAYHE